jgi:hypothetical protein
MLNNACSKYYVPSKHDSVVVAAALVKGRTTFRKYKLKKHKIWNKDLQIMWH